MSLESLIDAFDAYESIHEDKDDYVILTESSGDSDLESDIDFENPIQALDNELLSDIQLKDHFEQPLIQLTKYNIVSNIQYHLTPVEYSTTSDKGIAHIFCIEQWYNPSSLFKDVMSKPKGLYSKVYCHFLGVDCHETIKTCRGIKVCEIANMEIAKTSHSSVNPNTDLILHDDNNLINEQDQIKINTIGEYLATIKSNCPYKNYTCKGNLIIQYYNILRNESQNETTSNEEYIIQKSSSRGEMEIIKPFIGCNHWHLGCNIELLKDLFENNGTLSTYE
ncbi:29016_t:CDS:2, partial [Gigaspora margarita]